MKRARENALERLLRNATFAAPDAPADISFDVQTRILAGWRAGQKEGEALLGMLRKAVLAAAAASSVAIACAVVVVDIEKAKPEREIVASVTNSSVVAMEFTWIESEIGRQSGTDPGYP
jgi:anti-sigma-K factor RskA